jgi:hypothetical protein
MVSPQLKRILTKKNVPLISIDEGTQALVNLLEEPQSNPQWVIGNPLPFPAPRPNEELNQYRITRKLALADNPFLLDHVIGGNPVLPTVCAVAWFINSCEALYPGYQFFSVTDYKVFKGIVFNDESPSDYLLELKEVVKNSEAIRIEGKISSETNNGKTRYHYQAIVELRKKIPERPKIENFDLTRENPILGETLYESKVLFHGPSFRGIQQVLNISENGMTTECSYKSISSKDMGQFPIKAYNPYLADVHLQSLLIWAHHQKGSLGLPLQIAGGIQYLEVPDGEVTYATMRMRKVNSHKLVADVISHDRNGNVYMEVLSAEITLNEKLYDLFQDNQLEKEPEWM